MAHFAGESGFPAWMDDTDADIATNAADIAAHLADTVDAHDASAVSFVPAQGIAATTVQAAIEEVVTDASATYQQVAPAVLGRRWVGLGDSEMRAGDDPTGTSDAGDSWLNLLAIRSGGRIVYIRNAGIDGNTTTQMIARFATDVTAYSPEVVILHIGTASLTSMTVAAIVADIGTLVGMVRAIGATPVMCVNFPRNDTAQMRADLFKIGLYVRRYCHSNHVLCIDTYSPVVDYTTGAIAAAYDDGTLYHLNGAGRSLIADTILTAVDGLLPAAATDLLAWSKNDTTNLVPGPFFDADTNADGIANSWSSFGSGLAGAVRSRVAGVAPVVGYWQKITTDNTISAATSAGFSAPISAGWSVGDLMHFSCRVQFDAVGASSAGTVRILCNGSSATPTHPSRFLEDCIVDVSGIINRTFTVPTGTTSMTLYAYVLGEASLQIAQPRLVNLTTQGADI